MLQINCISLPKYNVMSSYSSNKAVSSSTSCSSPVISNMIGKWSEPMLSAVRHEVEFSRVLETIVMSGELLPSVVALILLLFLQKNENKNKTVMKIATTGCNVILQNLHLFEKVNFNLIVYNSHGSNSMHL